MSEAPTRPIRAGSQPDPDEEEDKRRKRALWWIFGGAVAALIIGGVIGALAFSSDDGGGSSQQVSDLRSELGDTRQQLRDIQQQIDDFVPPAPEPAPAPAAQAASCPDVVPSGGPDSDASISGVLVTGISCEDAAPLLQGVLQGTPPPGYQCTDQLIDQGGLPFAHFVCTQGAATIEYDQF